MIFDSVEAVNRWKFPAGEIGVRVSSRDFDISITARIRSSEDVMALLMMTDAYKRRGVKRFEVYIPYFPYARQDRVCNEGEAHSLKVFCDLINSQGYDKVYVLDPHSDVLQALLNNAVFRTNHYFVSKVIENIKDCALVSPDQGAAKKIQELRKYLNKPLQVFSASKRRDTVTGEIEGVDFPDIRGFKGTLLVVDDICDGGATFINLAKEIKKQDPSLDLQLCVTHGIFSRGLEPILEHYSHIYTTDSFKDFEDNEKLTVFNHKEIMQ